MSDSTLTDSSSSSDISSFQRPPELKENQIRVATYNVCNYKREEAIPELQWKNRFVDLIVQLCLLKADIICLQELRKWVVDSSTPEFFIAELCRQGGYRSILQYRNNTQTSLAEAILYKPTIFILENAHLVERDIEGGMSSIVGAPTATLRHIGTDVVFDVRSIHFDMEEDNKNSQIESLIVVTDPESVSHSSLVAGDFNLFFDKQGNEQLKNLEAQFDNLTADLRESKTKLPISGSFVGYSMNEFKADMKAPTKLDYIFATPGQFKVIGSPLVWFLPAGEEYRDKMASDHLPVTVDLEIVIDQEDIYNRVRISLDESLFEYSEDPSMGEEYIETGEIAKGLKLETIQRLADYFYAKGFSSFWDNTDDSFNIHPNDLTAEQYASGNYTYKKDSPEHIKPTVKPVEEEEEDGDTEMKSRVQTPRKADVEMDVEQPGERNGEQSASSSHEEQPGKEGASSSSSSSSVEVPDYEITPYQYNVVVKTERSRLDMQFQKTTFENIFKGAVGLAKPELMLKYSLETLNNTELRILKKAAKLKWKPTIPDNLSKIIEEKPFNPDDASHTLKTDLLEARDGVGIVGLFRFSETEVEYKVKFPEHIKNQLEIKDETTLFSSVFKITFMENIHSEIIKHMVETMLRNSECDLYVSERNVYSKMMTRFFTFCEVKSLRIYNLIEAILFQFRAISYKNQIAFKLDICPGEFPILRTLDIIGRFAFADVEPEFFRTSVNIGDIATIHGSTCFNADQLTCKADDKEMGEMLSTTVTTHDVFETPRCYSVGSVRYCKQNKSWVAPIQSSIITELYNSITNKYPDRVKLMKATFVNELFPSLIDVIGYITIQTNNKE